MAPAKSVASSSRRGNPTVPPKGNIKRRPTVSFQVEPPATNHHGQYLDEGNEEDREDEEENSGENMIDMLNILQEYQNKKSSKSSSRVAAIEAKKKEIRDLRNAEIHQMKEEGAAYIAQVKARVIELREQEVPPESIFVDVAHLFANRTRGIEAQLNILSNFLSELSPARLDLIEENSADVRSHPAKFEKIGRKVKKKAKKELQGGLEEQKLATEAQAYLKHFKHIVQI